MSYKTYNYIDKISCTNKSVVTLPMDDSRLMNTFTVSRLNRHEVVNRLNKVLLHTDNRHRPHNTTYWFYLPDYSELKTVILYSPDHIQNEMMKSTYKVLFIYKKFLKLKSPVSL